MIPVGPNVKSDAGSWVEVILVKPARTLQTLQVVLELDRGISVVIRVGPSVDCGLELEALLDCAVVVDVAIGGVIVILPCYWSRSKDH